jgi:hypothetical protein
MLYRQEFSDEKIISASFSIAGTRRIPVLAFASAEVRPVDDYCQATGNSARRWRQAHVRLPYDLHERLEQKAKASERTLAGEMRLRLEQSLALDDGEKAGDRRSGP